MEIVAPGRVSVGCMKEREAVVWVRRGVGEGRERGEERPREGGEQGR